MAAQFVTFGAFDNLSEEEILKDKDIFLERKKYLLAFLLYSLSNPLLLTEENLSQLDNLILQKLSEKKMFNGHISTGLSMFMISFGLSYSLLSKEEKNELLKIDYSYESFKNFILKIYNNYIEKAKRNTPPFIHGFFKEKCFIVYCHLIGNTNIKENNFFKLIRDYFILEKYKNYFAKYRNESLFENIKNNIISKYPELKDKYGTNRYLDMFYSYFDSDNDYNNEFLKKKLDNYYNKEKNKIKKEVKKKNEEKDQNDNEYTPLKEKID